MSEERIVEISFRSEKISPLRLVEKMAGTKFTGDFSDRDVKVAVIRAHVAYDMVDFIEELFDSIFNGASVSINDETYVVDNVEYDTDDFGNFINVRLFLKKL